MRRVVNRREEASGVGGGKGWGRRGGGRAKRRGERCDRKHEEGVCCGNRGPGSTLWDSW